jgi:hypothetical protein
MDPELASVLRPNQPWDTGMSPRYEDPQYHMEQSVQAVGVSTVTMLDPSRWAAARQQGQNAGSFQQWFQGRIRQLALEALTNTPSAQHQASHGQFVSRIGTQLNQELAGWGLALQDLRITNLEYGHDGFFKGFAKKAGPAMMLFGGGSAVLSFIGLNFKLLVWIDLWGDTVGWLIRGGLVAVGALLYLVSRDKSH